MKAVHLARLKLLALLFLLPGLAGLITSAKVSTRYADSLPRSPIVAQGRTVPRGIDGITIYQTEQENRKLNLMEDSSVGVFLLGLVLSMAYLEMWGSAQAGTAEQDADLLRSEE